jgi:hypothetical protein
VVEIEIRYVDSNVVTTSPQSHTADILPFERRWQNVSVLRCGIAVEVHLTSNGLKIREQMHKYDGFLARETSPDSETFLRLAIAADLLIDELTLSGERDAVVAIGTTIEPPRTPGSSDFVVTGPEQTFVVAGCRDGQRFAIGSFSDPAPTQDELDESNETEQPKVVAISVDRASACVILGQRGLLKPEDFEDLLRSFNGAGCVVDNFV